MKKVIKNRFFWIVVIIFVIAMTVSLSFCFACKKKNDDGQSSGGETEASLSLNKTGAILILGEEIWLKASYSGNGDKLTWWSSDDSVATVDAGRVVSKSVGTAVIKAKYADKEAECNITVTTGDMVPAMRFEGFSDKGEVTVCLSDKLNFNPIISFNGKDYNDGEFSATVADSSIGRVTDGIFIPLKTGETSVMIEGKWRGMSGDMLSKTINVRIINSLNVTVNGGTTSSLTLYRAETHAGKSYATYSPFEVNAVENGKEIDYEVLVSEGSDVVSYNSHDKTISALSCGTAVVTVKVINCNKEECLFDFPVNVIKPIADYGEILDFSTLDGELPVSEIFGEDTSLVEAYCEGKTLEIRDNKIFGINSSRTSADNKTLQIYDDKVGYNISLRVYAKILKNEADLSVFDVNQSGYFALAGDIVCSGTNTVSGKGTFTGVFDGRGYKISGIKVSGNGIFGTIGDSAQIKNLAITDADMSSYDSAIFAKKSATHYGAGALIENVYLSVKKVGSCPGVIMWTRCPWDKLNNVVIDVSCFSAGNFGNAYGALFADVPYAVADNGNNWNADKNNITNVYVIANDGVLISDNTVYNKNFPAKIYAANDGVSEDRANKVFVYNGVRRFGDLSSLAEECQKVGDWKISEAGVEWSKS